MTQWLKHLWPVYISAPIMTTIDGMTFSAGAKVGDLPRTLGEVKALKTFPQSLYQHGKTSKSWATPKN